MVLVSDIFYRRYTFLCVVIYIYVSVLCVCVSCGVIVFSFLFVYLADARRYTFVPRCFFFLDILYVCNPLYNFDTIGKNNVTNTQGLITVTLYPLLLLLFSLCSCTYIAESWTTLQLVLVVFLIWEKS